MNTIDLTPTWKTAAQIYATNLEHGPEEGKALARKRIRKMGGLIDDLQNELRAAREALKEAEARKALLKQTQDELQLTKIKNRAENLK